MKTNFVSIKNAVWDWVSDGGFGHDEIDEPLLIKWAVDCVRWCATQEQLAHRITILQVENSRATLPDDFVLLAQAASNVYYEPPCDCKADPEQDCCGKKNVSRHNRLPKTRREDIVQWVQGTLEKDCQLEINLLCPKCHNSSCSCDTPAVEVKVDRIWEMAHPEIYYSHFTRIGRFGNGPGQNSPYSSYYTPKFHLMKYAVNDYHRLNQLIGDCPNVNCDNCHREFIIDLPYIEVDFGEGEILLSYLGRHLDGDGDIMIPDHPDIFEAIVNHLDYKWYRSMFKKTGEQRYRVISSEAMQLREQHIGYAKSELEIPEFHQFKNYLESSNFHRRIPGWSDDQVGRRTVDKASKYGDILDGRI